MEIVTGRTGSPHITSVQDRALNQGIAGKGVYILNTGQNLKTEIASNNEIHINDGALLFQGCEFAVAPSTYDTITVPNGSQGMQRKDLITIKYTYDGSSQTEKGEWGYLQGTPDSNAPVVPSISSDGDLQKLDPVAEAAVFVVTLNGVNIISVEPVVSILAPLSTSWKTLWSGAARLGANTSINLSESLSNLQLGIVLEWQLAGNISDPPYGDSSFDFIPAFHRGLTVCASGTVAFGTNARKRIKINDQSISGEQYNTTYGDNGGISYSNGNMVLVAVYGR